MSSSYLTSPSAILRSTATLPNFPLRFAHQNVGYFPHLSHVCYSTFPIFPMCATVLSPSFPCVLQYFPHLSHVCYSTFPIFPMCATVLSPSFPCVLQYFPHLSHVCYSTFHIFPMCATVLSPSFQCVLQYFPHLSHVCYSTFHIFPMCATVLSPSFPCVLQYFPHLSHACYSTFPIFPMCATVLSPSFPCVLHSSFMPSSFFRSSWYYLTTRTIVQPSRSFVCCPVPPSPLHTNMPCQHSNSCGRYLQGIPHATTAQPVTLLTPIRKELRFESR